MTSGELDLSGPIADARRQAELWAEADPAYAELMATYVDIGELLDAGDSGERAGELRDLWRRGNAVHRRYESALEERWALWCAHNTTDIRGGAV